MKDSQTVYDTKGIRAHTHRELIRKWLEKFVYSEGFKKKKRKKKKEDRCTIAVRLGALRGQSRIRYLLPPPGFSASGRHLVSITGKPLGFPWIHVQEFIKWANKNLDSESIFFFAARIARVGYGPYPFFLLKWCLRVSV